MCAKKARFLVLLFHAIWEWEDCKQRRFCVDQERVERKKSVLGVPGSTCETKISHRAGALKNRFKGKNKLFWSLENDKHTMKNYAI